MAMCHFKSWLDFYSLDFGTEPLMNTPLIVFHFPCLLFLLLPSLPFFFFLSFFFIIYNPNFCLGRPFGFSTYRVRISSLPLGLLETCGVTLALICSLGEACRHGPLYFVTRREEGEKKQRELCRFSKEKHIFFMTRRKNKKLLID